MSEWIDLLDSENHTFDNTASGLTATTVKTALDEIVASPGSWTDGILVAYAKDELQTGAAATYAAVDGVTVKATLTASGTINLTTPAIASGESISFTVILNSGGFIPTFNVNSAALDFSVALPTYLAANRYAHSIFVDDTDAMLTGVSEMEPV